MSEHSDLDAALTRWERHGRPGLPERGFVLSRASGQTRRGIDDQVTGRRVFATDDHILRMAPSPDRRHIALQLAETADEQGHLALLDVATGRVRRWTEVACRYDPMLWDAGSRTVELFARPASCHVRLGADTGEISAVHTPQAAQCRLFPGGRAGLVALSSPGRATRILDHAGGTEIARFPAVRRIAELDGTAVVDDGTRLQGIDPDDGTLRWMWEDPEVIVTGWTTGEGTVVATGVRAGAGVVITLASGRRLDERPVAIDGEPATATGIAAGDGRIRLLVEGTTLPPTVLTLDELGPGAVGPGAVAGGPAARTDHHLAVADDGMRIPVTVTSPADAHGPGPMIVTCYGGFGVPAVPTYEPSVPAWIDCGGRHALVQVRGGGEHGRAWREAGRGVNKARAIADLACALRSLIAAGYARPEQIVLLGASHGGVLVTSCGLGHPELCAGIVSTAAPLNLLALSGHPLGAHWRSEFGAEDTAESRARLRAISPLHRAQTIDRTPPRFLGIVLDEDSRVAAVDTREVVTALHRAGGNARLHVLPGTGHGDNHLDRIHRFALLVLGFAASATGLRPDSETTVGSRA